VLSERWIVDLAIYVYALSLMFSFADLVQRNQRAGKFSYALLVLVWLLETGIVIIKVFQLFPIGIRLDALFIYAWVLLTFTVVMSAFSRMSLFYFATNLISFTVLACNFFFARHASIAFEKLLMQELVFVHVTMAVLAYAAFSLSSLGAGLYLLTNHLLKRKRWNRLLLRLPSLNRLDFFSHWPVVAGIAFLVASLILGEIYAYQLVGKMFWQDVKVWASLWVLGAYGWGMIQRGRSGWSGRRLAWWNLLSIFAVVFNYFINKSSLSFHHWI